MQMLDSFTDVFAIPTSLSPTQSCVHHVVFLYGTSPINLKLYRYLGAQKNVIEKLTRELLDNRVIQCSRSHFAILVVLVKKKNEFL